MTAVLLSESIFFMYWTLNNVSRVCGKHGHDNYSLAQCSDMRKLEHIHLDPGSTTTWVTVSRDMKNDLSMKVPPNTVEKASTYFTQGTSC